MLELEVSSQVPGMLALQYPANLRNFWQHLARTWRVSTCSPVSELVKLIDTCPTEQGGRDLGNPATISGYYERLREVGFGVCNSVPSLFADASSLTIHCTEVMSREPILEVRVCALESTFSSSETRIV